MSNLTGSSNSGSDWNDLCTTTLYIRPLSEELTHYEILSHFSAFGDVNYIRMRNETKHLYGLFNNIQICKETNSYGLVNFTRSESAAKALQVDLHTIAGRRVHVAVAHDRHQDKTSILGVKDDETTFMDLNDDCILEILSMTCLSVVDLCSVAETCPRLRDIASRVFNREHESCDIKKLSNYEVETTQRILMNFGSEISHLHLDINTAYGDSEYVEWSRAALNSVTEYCNDNLQQLGFQNSHISENFTAKLRILFSKLQKLEKLVIKDSTFEGASKELFADCGSLLHLEIKEVGDDAEFIFENTFPKLELFFLWNSFSKDSLDSFISRHTYLKEIIICNDLESSSLQLIAGCKRLELFSCYIHETVTFDFTIFGHLRTLGIGCRGRDVMTVALGLNNLQFLEDLTLINVQVGSELVRTLSQLEELRMLYFVNCSGLQYLNQMGDMGQLTTLEIHSYEHVDLDIVHLVSRLGKLNCLKVEVREFAVDLKKYLKIVDVVRRRPDTSKLTFRLVKDYEYEQYYDHLLPDFSRNAHIVEMILAYDF